MEGCYGIISATAFYVTGNSDSFFCYIKSFAEMSTRTIWAYMEGDIGMNVSTAGTHTYDTGLIASPDSEKAAKDKETSTGLEKIAEYVAKADSDIQERISKERQEACERARKRMEEKEAEQKREHERALKKARKKALEKQQMLKREELTELYERLADKRREYSRYLNESSIKRGEAFGEDAKRPKSMNVRAVKSYEASFMLDIRQEMGI